MKPIIKVQSDYHGVVDMEIMLGNVCNYSCSYCFPGSNEGDVRWPNETFNTLLDNVLSLIKFYQTFHNKKLFDIKVVGGEPTLWPQLPKFITSIKQNADAVIRMSTNGSRTVRYWNDYAELFDKIIISVHNEYADLDHIINVADTIYNLKTINLYVLVLMDPHNWNKSVENYFYLLENSKDWHLSVSPVTFDGATIYSNEQVDFLQTVEKRRPEQPNNLNIEPTTEFFDEDGLIETNQHEIIVNNQNTFKGYNCNIGIDRLFITKQGNIQGACSQDINLGNIYDPTFQEKLDRKLLPVICNVERCSCSSEILVSKYES